MKAPVVYTMTFSNGAMYVGATHNLASRRHAHRKDMRCSNAVNRKVQAAFDLCGEPEFQAVASLLQGAELHELEREVICSMAPELNMQPPTRIHTTRVERRASKAPHPPKKWGRYASVGEAARVLSIPYRTAKRWARMHNTPEEAIQWVEARRTPKPNAAFVGPRQPPGLVCIDGVVDFPRALLAKLGKTEQSYRRNRRAGMSQVDAIRAANLVGYVHPNCISKKAPPMPRPKKHFTVNGATHTYASASKAFQIPENTLRQRIHNGWTPEEACGLVPRPLQQAVQRVNKAKLAALAKREARMIEYMGVRATLPEHCRAHGVCESLVRSRLRLGWGIEQAMQEPPRWSKPAQGDTLQTG